jgi:hypothetical protein
MANPEENNARKPKAPSDEYRKGSAWYLDEETIVDEKQRNKGRHCSSCLAERKDRRAGFWYSTTAGLLIKWLRSKTKQ